MTCAQCGEQGDGRFCQSCGHALDASSSSGVQLATKPAPSNTILNPPPQSLRLGKQCVNCRQSISTSAEICPHCGVRQMPPPSSTGEKSKIAAGLLAIFLGGLGIHKFYLGETGAGVGFLIASIVSACLWVVLIGVLGTLIIWIVALVQGITYLCMSDAAFAAKYG